MNSSHCWIENSYTFNIRADFSYHLSMSKIQFISTHKIEVAKEVGAYMLLTNCPSRILSLEKGLELMRKSGDPMEFGIFDFPKFSQGLLVKGGMG